MNYSIRYSSIKRMLRLMSQIKEGLMPQQDIEALLSHEDYVFEFERYEGRVSRGEYADYLQNILHLKEADITNKDLKTHHKYYEDLLAHLDFYSEALETLENTLTPSLIEAQIAVALKGLPDDLVLPEMHFILTIGIGQSGGYVHGHGMHFDFLQLAKERSIDDFCATIAHEIHHVGMGVAHQDVDGEALSLEALYYAFFAGEGLAVKYCNNAEGILSQSIYSGEKNIGLDAYSWKYLNDDFDRTMAAFKQDIQDIRQKRIINMDQLHERLENYWMNPYVEGQSQEDIPRLKHFRLYSFGNDIWGIIHDAFGKAAVYETLLNPEMFPERFNQALEIKGFREIWI